jgi:hypothetical protein
MELGVNQASQDRLRNVNRIAQWETSRGTFGLVRDQIFGNSIVGKN